MGTTCYNWYVGGRTGGSAGDREWRGTMRWLLPVSFYKYHAISFVFDNSFYAKYVKGKFLWTWIKLNKVIPQLYCHNKKCLGGQVVTEYSKNFLAGSCQFGPSLYEKWIMSFIKIIMLSA